jgi:hypothetical protein
MGKAVDREAGVDGSRIRGVQIWAAMVLDVPELAATPATMGAAWRRQLPCWFSSASRRSRR